jgi:hypothetical protein
VTKCLHCGGELDNSTSLACKDVKACARRQIDKGIAERSPRNRLNRPAGVRTGSALNAAASKDEHAKL